MTPGASRLDDCHDLGAAADHLDGQATTSEYAGDACAEVQEKRAIVIGAKGRIQHTVGVVPGKFREVAAVLTGDNDLVSRTICKQVGLSVEKMLLGSDVEKMPDERLADAANEVT